MLAAYKEGLPSGLSRLEATTESSDASASSSELSHSSSDLSFA